MVAFPSNTPLKGSTFATGTPNDHDFLPIAKLQHAHGAAKKEFSDFSWHFWLRKNLP